MTSIHIASAVASMDYAHISVKQRRKVCWCFQGLYRTGAAGLHDYVDQVNTKLEFLLTVLHFTWAQLHNAVIGLDHMFLFVLYKSVCKIKTRCI